MPHLALREESPRKVLNVGLLRAESMVVAKQAGPSVAARFRGPAAIYTLVAAFGACATWLVLSHVQHLTPIHAPFSVPWWALVIGFAAAEIFVIHVDRGGQTHTFSLVEVPLVVGLFMAHPLHVVGARLLGGGLALGLHRRQAPAKLAFNLSLFALETCVAVTTFSALAGTHASMGPRAWLPALMACALENVVGVFGVSLAILATSGHLTRRALSGLLIEGAVLGPVANSSLALCVTVLLWFEPLAAVLTLPIVAVLVAAYRGYASLKQRYANLNKLYEFNKRTQHGADVDSVASTVLEAARSVMNAEIGHLVVLTESRTAAIIVTVDATGTAATRGPVSVAELGPLWVRASESTGGVLIASAAHEDRSALAELGWHDCLAVNFHRDGEIRGLVAVANRAGMASFDQEDLALFRAVVSHAEVILDNSELVSRLQHEALHDSLTSLPNRASFNHAIEKALHHRVRGEKVGVLLMDLDRFKDVNDTLGHHHGDQLLVEVGRRLRDAVPAGSSVARLGGDEFAVLLPATSDEASFVELARTLDEVLRHGIDVEDIQVEAAASIGVAVCPDHGEDAITLLQRADVAMYMSKESGGVEIYSPDRDINSRGRLGLVAELRAALENEELEVWYQPQADARSGAVCAIEALVRWRHPTRGLISPDDFIPVAEQTGLIRPLAAYVIERAAQQWQVWNKAHLAVDVAVNLSMRNLQDRDLVEELHARLERFGMPTTALKVEITESSIMSDSARTVESLEALARAGVSVSVDDFGTGYSSLTHLRQLPVREVKIDKSFVMNMNTDAGDAAVVRSVIDLARNLGLEVVAEGVETPEAWETLTAWGCDRVQGYYLSKPLPPQEITAWMMDRPAAGASALVSRAPRTVRSSISG